MCIKRQQARIRLRPTEMRKKTLIFRTIWLLIFRENETRERLGQSPDKRRLALGLSPALSRMAKCLN